MCQHINLNLQICLWGNVLLAIYLRGIMKWYLFTILLTGGGNRDSFTPGPESIRGPKQCWTRSSESGSSFTSQCIASLRWSFCCIQLISSQPASWFLYATDANLCTPYLMQSSARVPYVMHFSETIKDRNHKVCTVCMKNKPQKSPEHSPEHVKSLPLDLTQSVYYGPYFYICPGPSNPLDGPVYLHLLSIFETIF